MPRINAHLLAAPPLLPTPVHDAGGMTGAQCLHSLANLYDAAGEIRLLLLSLQAQVILQQGANGAQGR